MTKYLNRTFMGRSIYECEAAPSERSAYSHKGKWTVQTFHQTGTPYADELCPHFPTLAEARQYIRERHKR